MENCSSGSTLYLLRIPWPCTGDVASQRSRTWRQQRGSQQRLGCLAPRTPAGSGSSGPGFDDLSFSWQNAGGSPCGVLDTQPCQKPHYICYRYQHIITESTGIIGYLVWWLKGWNFCKCLSFSQWEIMGGRAYADRLKSQQQPQNKATYCVISWKPLCQCSAQYVWSKGENWFLTTLEYKINSLQDHLAGSRVCM